MLIYKLLHGVSKICTYYVDQTSLELEKSCNFYEQQRDLQLWVVNNIHLPSIEREINKAGTLFF
jgi:anti-sigma-K factor RskA